MEMIHSTLPPTMAAIHARYDKEWGATPHSDVCVQIKRGTARIAVFNLPTFEVYWTPPGTNVDIVEYADGITATVRPPHEHDNGVLCLGVEKRT